MLAFITLPLLTLTAALAAPAPMAPASQGLAKRFTGVKIKAGRGDFCLSPVDPEYCPESGVQVVTVPCADATYTWDINPGSGSVTLTDYPDLALDAGEWPGNGGQLKVWTSYPGLMQQTWYYTDDQRIAITGGTQCLDQGDQGVQTWQCTYMNTNQIWVTV